jgi:glycerol-3-phosphate dehydrogenase
VIADESYDLIIIGGGINAAGVAQVAAAAGYRILLRERNWAPGMETSSASSKLIHGGLRYLESLEFSLVRESLRERDLLLELAPSLVHLQTFNLPVYAHTRRSALKIASGLSLYAVLGGLRRWHFFQRLPRTAWDGLEGLTTSGLQAVFRYQDAQTDDRALTGAVMTSAMDLGAHCVFGARFSAAEKLDDGLVVAFVHSGHRYKAKARVLVNAAGPWIEEVNTRILPLAAMPRPSLVQGAHLAINTPLDQAYYLEAPRDGRAVFLLPWQGYALLGTTESPLPGMPAKIGILDSERDYLMDIYTSYFPAKACAVLDTMVGCRVLPTAHGGIFSRSREIMLHVDRKTSPRVVTLVGGKLTVYRRSALKVMTLLRAALPRQRRIADTAELRLQLSVWNPGSDGSG